MSLPLRGVTIIDMTRLLPGPAATMHFVDFGADVIKVEDTGVGDYMRNFPPTIALNGDKTVNAAFEAVNRGKRSIAIDLKSAEGREVLLRLVDRADALIEGFRPGVLDRLSLGWATLHARNPRLVLCSLSGYGQHGPLSQRAGHDLNYMAMTGVLDQIRAGGKLAIPNLQIGDLLGGTLSALATMLIAMLGAQRSGQGVHVDVAMTDGLLAHHLFPHASVDSGVDPIAEQTLLTGGVACYQIYQTSDRHHLALGALELKFWQAFCEAAGLSELKSRHWELGEAPGSPSAIRDDRAGRAAYRRTSARSLAESVRASRCVRYASVDSRRSAFAPASSGAQPRAQRARRLRDRPAGADGRHRTGARARLPVRENTRRS